MQLQPYLFFEGRCEEAAEYYGKALGAEVLMMLRFSESPEPASGENGCQPGDGDKVMHMSLRIGDTVVMASDGGCSGQPNFQGVALTLTTAEVAEADRWFDALADGGDVKMPLAPTFFSPRFGMVADRFGLSWMIMVAPQEAADAPADAERTTSAGA